MQLNKFEVWVGHYNANGLPEPEAPQLVATVVAASFKMACLKYELGVKMNHILQCEAIGQPSDDESCEWFYDFKINRNFFVGHYFPTEDEAWGTFPKGKSIIIQQ